MITRAQKFRLGIFVVVSISILLVLLVTTIGTSLLTDRDIYQIHYSISVSGLEIGAPVKYNGVRVGRVEHIKIDPEKVSNTIVTISLQAGTPIKANAVAMLNVQGITGLKFIELIGGTSGSKTLEPGPDSRIPGGTTVGGLTGQAEVITVKVERLIALLQAVVSEQNVSHVANILKQTDDMLGENKKAVGQMIKNLSIGSARLAETMDKVSLTAQAAERAMNTIQQTTQQVFGAKRWIALIKQVEGLLIDVRKRVGKDELGKATFALEKLLTRATGLVDRVDLVVGRSREQIRSSLRYLSETSENLRDFSRLIREDPSRLLRKQEREERVLP